MNSLTGHVVDGKYLVGECLGAGGMGAVFRAEHVGIGRHVALKVMQPELLTDPNAIERFKREARAAGALRHPNVVNVTDFGVAELEGNTTTYLVMEYLTGQTLAQILETRKQLSLRLVVDITAQIAEALEVAHGRGIVHRDLKPANIWLTPDQRGGFRVTLLDFGIAKLRDDALADSRALPPLQLNVSASDATVRKIDGEATTQVAHAEATPVSPAPPPRDVHYVTTDVTRAGEIIGTPAYMSPEQCAAQPVDARSDIYSLGVVVYRMLTGELPFTGSTAELLRQHVSAAIPQLEAKLGRHRALAGILRRALAKRPEDRFQSPKAFAAAFQAHSLDTTDSLRRAVALFADRLPELRGIAAWLMLPGLLAMLLCAALWRAPYVWPLLLAIALTISGVTAMASVAAIWDDLKQRPFVPIIWRTAAESVSGARRGTIARWFWQPLRDYVACVRQSRGNSMRTMLMFVSRFRRSASRPDDARLVRMAAVLPKGAFQTMAGLQLFSSCVAPAIAMLAAFGLGTVLRMPGEWLLGLLAGGFVFSLTLSLQILVAIVDLMLYDLAFDMSAE